MKTILCNPKVKLSLKVLRKLFPGEYRRYFELLTAKGTLTSYVLVRLRKKPLSPSRRKSAEEEDLQYFADIRSFESIAPEVEATSKNFKIPEHQVEELKDEDKEVEQGADERQSFAIQRSEKMTTEDYKEFINSRGVGMLYKGKKALCRWLNVAKEVSSSKHLIEIVSLVAKFSLRRIVEEAIRKRSPTGSLEIIAEPLTMKEMAKSVDMELKLIKELVNNVNACE